jgi:hypothetical protein
MTSPLRYSLTGLDRGDFDEADRLVKSVLHSSGPVRNQRIIRTVTSDLSQLVKRDRLYVETSSALDGVCCALEHNDEEFDIWLNPLMDPYTDVFRVTLLHELSHVYIGLKHDHRFKGFLGRVMYAYCDLVSPLSNLDLQVHYMLNKYTRIRSDEHYNAYTDRLSQRAESIREAAEIEFERVKDLFTR